MVQEQIDIDDLIASLRSDLPAQADEERIRSNLLGLGVLTQPHEKPWLNQAASLGPAVAPSGLFASFAAATGSSKALVFAVVVGAVAVTPGFAHKVSEVLSSDSAQVHELEAVGLRRGVQSSNAASTGLAPSSGSMPQPAGLVSGTSSPQLDIDTSVDVDTSAHGQSKAAEPKRASPSRTETHSAENSQLDQETRLMERAISAVQRGNTSDARDLLAEHAARFPRGLLAPERERLNQKLNSK